MAAPDIPTRRAALLLHAQPPHLRRQILAKLTVDEAEALRPLLDELRYLGIPAGLAGLEQLIHPGIAARGATGSADVTEQLQTFSATEIATALQSCAALTIAVLLEARDWTWKQNVLSLIPEPRKAEAGRCMQRGVPKLGVAALNFLIARLHAEAIRLRATSASAVPVAARASSKRWTAWMR